ncbi:MAG: hypothetical protein KJO91_07285 [Gammaproteobacteria bacterium]|nr:hypothetical protein [Gammaproteobacteria bacterium]
MNLDLNIKSLSIVFSGMILAGLSGLSVAMDFYFSGFGTIGVSCFSNDDADFRRDDVPKGPGRTHRCSGELDSKLGIQGDWQLTDELAGSLQATAIHNTDDNFEPQLTMANLRWEFTDDWKLRVGRMQNPNFLYSEYRNVTYAQPWARPPGEVYNMLPTFLHDGIELLHTSQVKGWKLEYHMGLAQSDFNFPLSNTAQSLDVTIQTSYLNITAEKGPWLLKAGVAPSRADASSPMVEMLLAGLRGSGEFTLANDIEIKDKPYTLYSAGFSYDDGIWIFGGELLTRPTEGFVQQPTTGYLMAGKRFGPWMPYASVARLTGRQDDARNTLPAAHPMFAQVEGLLSSTHDLDRTTLSVGFSRELTDQFILKVQADFIKPDQNSFGDYINHSANYDFADPGVDTLFTVNLDFVF